MMQVKISAENERFVDSIVSSGVFCNRDAVLDRALSLLRSHEELRRAIAEGMEGETIPGDVVFEHLERRVAEIETGQK
jgi:Arc/MetJ-type ribon-helix-helix transcriptional regulator